MKNKIRQPGSHKRVLPCLAAALVLLFRYPTPAPISPGSIPPPAASHYQWIEETRTLEFSGPQGIPWLTAGTAHIALADGTVIRSSDPRFRVAASQFRNRLVLTGTDSRGILDWEIVIRALGSASVRAEFQVFNRGKDPLRLDRIEVLEGLLPSQVDPENNRLLLNGHNSWRGVEVGRLEPGKPAESYYTISAQSPPLAAGFLAGRRNLDRLSLEIGRGGVILKAYGDCDGCILPAGGSRSADPLFVSGEANPLAQMERFADLAAEENGVRLWPENFATWCSWYAGWIRQEPLHLYKGGLEKGVEINIPLVKNLLGTRGEPSMRIVDDSNEMAYGDWDNRTLAIPGGFDSLAASMTQKGIRAGIWYPSFWVSTKSRLFREHEDYLYKNEDGSVETREMYGNRIGYLDASHPAAARTMESTARAWRDRGFRYVMTDFMNWGARDKPRFDPTMTGVEAHNRGLEAMRRGFGKDTYWLHCGALLGPAMGLCDGMRISGDSHGGALYSYTSAATRWFYNWRVWLNDPDAIVCVRRGEAKTVDWSRSWMSWMALSGSVLTYGDTLDDLPPAYLDVYRKILPPLPVAGRPLDIWENEPNFLWGMAPGEADGPLILFGVFEFQGKHLGETITLNLDEIAARSRSWTERPARSPAVWLLWDFWKRTLTRVKGARVTMGVPEKSGSLYALRPALGRPQLLGTSGHFSQGVLETRNIRWNEKARRLTGFVRGNGGGPTTLFVHVPGGMTCEDAYVDYQNIEREQVKPGVIAIQVPAVRAAMVTFELRFQGSGIAQESRGFSPGTAGKLSRGAGER